MPIDDPDPSAYSAHSYSANFDPVRAGSPWQTLRLRVTSWYRPGHPRFGLHLFLSTLASGLLLSLAWLAMHGVMLQLRHDPTNVETSVSGAGSPLPRPMTDGRAALSDAGVAQSSSWTIQEGGHPAPIAEPDAVAENDAEAVDFASAVNTPADILPVPATAENGAVPGQDAAPELAPTGPTPADAVRIGPKIEVTLSVQIDEQGNPIQVGVQRSSGSPALDNAALLQVRSRHFSPVLRDGEPVPATLIVPVQLTAQDH